MDTRSNKKYRETLSNTEFIQEKGEEEWSEIKHVIQKAIVKEEITVNENNMIRNYWWDKECLLHKREAAKSLRMWKKGNTNKEEYIEARQVCKQKKEQRQAEMRKEMKDINNEAQVWKFIKKREE